MTVASQRFNYLDKETNVSTKDFSSFSDNAVYNTMDLVTDSGVALAQGSEKVLNTLNTSINDLQSMLASDEVADTLKDALDSAMDTMSNMDLPDVVRDIFDSLKKLDLSGVKSFFKDLLHVGSTFLCNNLDFLKLFMLGYALNKNILSGLLVALLLSWLDRYCKGFTQEEMAKSNKKQSMDMMFPPKGVSVNSNNSFNLFTKYYSDHLKSKLPLPVVSAMNNSTFLANVLTGDIKSSINNLRGAEISHTQRNTYLNTLNTGLSSHSPTSQEYRNILSAKGDLMNTPLVSVERRDKNIRYDNLSDKLGSYVKNLSKVDLHSNSFMSLSATESELYSKMVELKATSASSSAIQTTPNNSFSDFDFDSVMPTLTNDQVTLLEGKNIESDSHRLYDLHPTTEVFLQET